MRTCVGCGVSQPIESFNRDSKQPDGRRRRCRTCTRKEMAAWRAAHPDNNRHWLASHRERQVEHDRNQRERFPEKMTARRKLDRAIRSGRVVRPTACSSCGASGRIEGHHDDYSRPLDVRWLCVVCHKSLHMEVAA